MVIVESQNEVNEFLQMWETTPSTIIPIWSDLDKHPMNNELSFLFVRMGNTDFILIYNHIDGKFTPESFGNMVVGYPRHYPTHYLSFFPPKMTTYDWDDMIISSQGAFQEGIQSHLQQ